MVASLEEVLALEVLGPDGVDASEGRPELTLGEKLRRREAGRRVGLLGRGSAALHALDGRRIAGNRMGRAHGRTLLGERAGGTKTAKLLGLVQEHGLGGRIGREKDVEGDNASQHEPEADHLRLRKLHVYINR